MAGKEEKSANSPASPKTPGTTDGEKRSNLAIQVWKEAAEHTRHFNGVYWQTNRFFTSLIILTVGAAGALLTVDIDPSLARALSVLLFALAAFWARFGMLSAQRHGEHCGFFSETHRIAEKAVLKDLDLTEPDRAHWRSIRDLDTEKMRKDPKGGFIFDERSIRLRVEFMFLNTSRLFFSAAAICFLALLWSWLCALEQNSEKHKDQTPSIILPGQAKPSAPKGK